MRYINLRFAYYHQVRQEAKLSLG